MYGKEIICRNHYNVILHLCIGGNLLKRSAENLTLEFKFVSSCMEPEFMKRSSLENLVFNSFCIYFIFDVLYNMIS